MHEQINDSIDVSVDFSQTRVRPTRFIWHGREYPITQVNLVFSKREGRTKFYYFAVSAGPNYFKLQLDTEKLTWILQESSCD